jgi:hypothetical protein
LIRSPTQKKENKNGCKNGKKKKKLWHNHKAIKLTRFVSSPLINAENRICSQALYQNSMLLFILKLCLFWGIHFPLVGHPSTGGYGTVGGLLGAGRRKLSFDWFYCSYRSSLTYMELCPNKHMVS